MHLRKARALILDRFADDCGLEVHKKRKFTVFCAVFTDVLTGYKATFGSFFSFRGLVRQPFLFCTLSPSFRAVLLVSRLS